MRIFLLWHTPEHNPFKRDVKSVADNLHSIFRPLFKSLPLPKTIETPFAKLVWIELPVGGWRASFFQEDDETWAFAPDFPVDALGLLQKYGINVDEENVLPVLCRRLESNPVSVLRDLSPYFSVIWSSKRTGEVFVQNDGVGRSQLFEYKEGEQWALSNRVFSFKALGVNLEPAPEDWAARWVIGHFPLNLSGYRSVGFLEGASRIHLTSHSLKKARYDILSEWLSAPGSLPRQDCLELGRQSLIAYIKSSMLMCNEKPSIGLTGGWDSRAVASSFRAAGIEFTSMVRGKEWRPDVVIARKLADIAGVNLRVRNSGKVPPDNAEDCRRSITLALLHNGGARTAQSYKTFLAHTKQLGSAKVGITGHGAEICKSFYLKRLGKDLSQDRSYDELFVETLLKKAPPLLRKSLHQGVREILMEACRSSDLYGLKGLARWDYLYLSERDRRFIGSHVGARTGLVISPFLNPDFIRSCFAYGDRYEEENPFQRYMVSRNAPDWIEVPYEDDLKKQLKAEGGSQDDNEDRKGKKSWVRPRGRHDYDNLAFWQDTGKPIIDECIAEGGFWSEVFDPSLIKTHWERVPDELVAMYLITEILNKGPL